MIVRNPRLSSTNQKRLALGTALVSAFLLGASSASAAIHLDFGAAGTPGQRVAPGYNGVSGSSSANVTSVTVPPSALPDGETLVITSSTSQLIYRDRGNYSTTTAPTNAELVEDYLRVGTGATTGSYATMTLTLGNLQANTLYDFTFRMYEGGANNTNPALWGPYDYTITGTGDTDPANNTFTTGFDSSSSPTPTAGELAGYTARFLTSGTGTLVLTITQTSGLERNVPLNSLDAVVVPEPASVALATCAFAGLVLRPRRSTK